MLAFWHDRAPPQTPLGVHFIDIAGGLFRLGSGFLGVLVVGLDVLGHDFGLFR
jgi:hypothetical protein